MTKKKLKKQQVIFSRTCGWWEYVPHPVLVKDGEPHCPKCGGKLTMVKAAAWWQSIADNAEKAPDPTYRDFICWMRGQCFVRGIAVARAAWNLERGSFG